MGGFVSISKDSIAKSLEIAWRQGLEAIDGLVVSIGSPFNRPKGIGLGHVKSVSSPFNRQERLSVNLIDTEGGVACPCCDASTDLKDSYWRVGPHVAHSNLKVVEVGVPKQVQADDVLIPLQDRSQPDSVLVVAAIVRSDVRDQDG